MIWHLIAAVFAGLAAAGIALLLRKLSGRRLPKWIIPVFAGLAMLGYQIYYEYSWFDHQQSRQPEGSVVISSERDEVFWRPWTYYYPMTVAFTVVDTNNLITHDTEDATLVEFMLYRFEKKHIDYVTHRAHVLNCDTAEVVPLTEDRQADLAQLRTLEPSDKLYKAVCQS
ncbi:hypothetical protein [Nitrincola iocasae]|jgi:hypothetical protein|uniref:Uncharacterized protein n=1 Tax=Nitrincola iocasae TaxID=2614693 RepID=A0A5J6LA15_9GAMM|nr:hypothetical protein [Nitrincola iocasae]QEW05454.1 hypothetical protein F5I99_02505 [Nitrincola iocasae]